MDSIFDEATRSGFCWAPEIGMGRLPRTPENAVPYDDAYWEKYVAYADTPLGKELTAFRVHFVDRHILADTKAAPARVGVLDFGIGCGQFVEARPGTFGYDVNPRGIAWLQERGLWLDPYGSAPCATGVTFWDTLEHVEEPERAVAAAERWVFASLPIFQDMDHVLRSKHYRPGEHVSYWTRAGFVAWMGRQGFSLVQLNRAESTRFGRESIETFAFRRD